MLIPAYCGQSIKNNKPVFQSSWLTGFFYFCCPKIK